MIPNHSYSYGSRSHRKKKHAFCLCTNIVENRKLFLKGCSHGILKSRALFIIFSHTHRTQSPYNETKYTYGSFFPSLSHAIFVTSIFMREVYSRSLWGGWRFRCQARDPARSKLSKVRKTRVELNNILANTTLGIQLKLLIRVPRDVL